MKETKSIRKGSIQRAGFCNTNLHLFHTKHEKKKKGKRKMQEANNEDTLTGLEGTGTLSHSTFYLLAS